MRTRTVMIAAAMLLPPLVADAQEYCVTCKGPDASYRCVIGGDATAAARNSRGQFLCITELAKAGGHTSCSAARGQATPCPGETRIGDVHARRSGRFALWNNRPRPAQPRRGSWRPSKRCLRLPSRLPAPAPMQTTAPVEEKKPTVVEDLANKTGKAVTDTGEAVGGAMKKTWDCVASLFGKC